MASMCVTSTDKELARGSRKRSFDSLDALNIIDTPASVRCIGAVWLISTDPDSSAFTVAKAIARRSLFLYTGKEMILLMSGTCTSGGPLLCLLYMRVPLAIIP